MPQLVIGISKKCSNSGLKEGRWPRLPSSTSHPVECSQGSLWGLSSEDVPSSGAHKRVHVSLAYVGLGTRHASPGIYPGGSCSCGGTGIWCCWLLCLAFQYSIPKCGQHPMPIGAPPWLPGGLCHVSHPSLGFSLVARLQNGCSSPPLVLFQLGSTLPPLKVAPQGGQNVSGGLFHPFGPTGQWARYLLSIYTSWKRPLISSQEVNTPQAGWQEHMPQGPASEDHASNLGRSAFLPPSVPTHCHVQTSLEG